MSLSCPALTQLGQAWKKPVAQGAVEALRYLAHLFSPSGSPWRSWDLKEGEKNIYKKSFFAFTTKTC